MEFNFNSNVVVVVGEQFCCHTRVFPSIARECDHRVGIELPRCALSKHLHKHVFIDTLFDSSDFINSHWAKVESVDEVVVEDCKVPLSFNLIGRELLCLEENVDKISCHVMRFSLFCHYDVVTL